MSDNDGVGYEFFGRYWWKPVVCINHESDMSFKNLDSPLSH